MTEGLDADTVAAALIAFGGLLQVVSMYQIIRDIFDDARAIAAFRGVQLPLLQQEAAPNETERTHGHERARFDKLLDDLFLARWTRRWRSVLTLIVGTLVATVGGLVAVLA